MQNLMLRNFEEAGRAGSVDPLTVFDLGLNNGDDSAYYLSRGYRVVAVEANSVLAERARFRFRSEISSGQFVLENVGISQESGRIPFWINEQRDVFSSLDLARASRNGMKVHAVEVECIRFDTLLRKHGVPYYLKLDVEGAETHCLTCLQRFPLPAFISVEAESMEYLLLLWQLGYRDFKVVDQMGHNSQFPVFSNENPLFRALKFATGMADRFRNRVGDVTFPRGSSGPFGEDTRGEWQSFDEVSYNWMHFRFGHKKRGTLGLNSWYDFHAKAPIADRERR